MAEHEAEVADIIVPRSGNGEGVFSPGAEVTGEDGIQKRITFVGLQTNGGAEVIKIIRGNFSDPEGERQAIAGSDSA